MTGVQTCALPIYPSAVRCRAAAPPTPALWITASYGPSALAAVKQHKVYQELVYNHADIDGSKVVWARSLGAEKDAEGLECFAGEADSEEQQRAGEEREELLRSRRLASGGGQRDGLGGQEKSG